MSARSRRASMRASTKSNKRKSQRKANKYRVAFKHGKNCSICNKQFNILSNPEHNCRFCGQCVCASCSRHRMKTPHSKNLKRACDGLFSPRSLLYLWWFVYSMVTTVYFTHTYVGLFIPWSLYMLYIVAKCFTNIECLPITDSVLLILFLWQHILTLPRLSALDCLKSGVLTTPSASRMSSNSFASENYSSNSDHSDDESAPRVRSSTFHQDSARKVLFPTRTKWEVWTEPWIPL